LAIFAKISSMLTKILAESLIQKAKHLIAHADKLVLLTHTSPDGDAVGSCLAMADYLTNLGKTVQVIFPDPLPPFLAWLPGAEEALVYATNQESCQSFINQAEAILMLDFNHPGRMGAVAELVSMRSVPKILFDHHPDPASFADVTISYPQISSTAEIVFRYICRTSFFDEMSKNCAVCLYTGMMTDTGAFTYNSNQEEIYFIISQLLQKGINKDEIYDKVYNTYTADRMRLMGYVLYRRLRVVPECHAAFLTLSLDDLKDFNYQVVDTEGFVNLPLSIQGIAFSVFMRENGNGIRLSFRSKGKFPSNRIASDLFGGGGHVNAAGADFAGTLEEAARLIEEALPRYLKEWPVD
jgi:phosphoesterase RecJ-like protein